MTRWSVLIGMMAVAVLPWGSAAEGQKAPPTGSVIPRSGPATLEPGRDHGGEALDTMRAYGMCAARDHLRIKKLLAALPESKDEYKAAGWAATNACINNGVLSFNARLLRGVSAESLVTEMNGADPRTWAKMPTFDVPSADMLKAAEPAQRTAVALVLFGQCVATADMADVGALLATDPDSQAETDAFQKLQTAFGPCATKGVSFSLNRFQLRGYLAEGAYRAKIMQAKDLVSAQG